MLLFLGTSFSFLLRNETKVATASNVRVVPLYNALNGLLKDRSKNMGPRFTQEELLRKTDYVLNAF